MEFESPVRGRDGSIDIKVNTETNCLVEYLSSDKIPTPKDVTSLSIYCAEVARPLESYSIKWLSSPIFAMYFIKNLSHKWDYKSHVYPQYSDTIQTFNVRQVWCPDRIQIIRGSYIFYWNLVSVEYKAVDISSGQDEFPDIPYSNDFEIATIIKSPRAKLIQKIREARIRATAAKCKLNILLDSYYTKYGLTEGLHKESDLSSEIDSNTESSAKK